MADLPPADVKVKSEKSPDGSSEGFSITVTRPGDEHKGRTWLGEGKSVAEAAGEAVKKMVGDRRLGEFLP